jgi:two-component system sensor kinase FixL
LEHWAGEVSELFHVTCRFERCDPVFVHEEVLADHLYRLTQEAVTNAIKHGRAHNISIMLAVVRGGGELTIRDDGCGFEVDSENSSGLGLRIMNYRAKMISGSFHVESSTTGGTVVRCLFPIAGRAATHSLSGAQNAT